MSGQGNFGFDAARKEYVDLVEAGIVDPVKGGSYRVGKRHLGASVLLLTEATMTEIPKAKREQQPVEPETAM